MGIEFILGGWLLHAVDLDWFLVWFEEKQRPLLCQPDNGGIRVVFRVTVNAPGLEVIPRPAWIVIVIAWDLVAVQSYDYFLRNQHFPEATG